MGAQSGPFRPPKKKNILNPLPPRQDFVPGWRDLPRKWQLEFLCQNAALFAGLVVRERIDGVLRLQVDPTVFKFVLLRMAWARWGSKLADKKRPGVPAAFGLPTPPHTYSLKAASVVREMLFKEDGNERSCLPNDDMLDCLAACVNWSITYAQVWDHRLVPLNGKAYLEINGDLFRVLSLTFAMGPAGIRAHSTFIEHRGGKWPREWCPRQCAPCLTMLTGRACGRTVSAKPPAELRGPAKPSSLACSCSKGSCSGRCKCAKGKRSCTSRCRCTEGVCVNREPANGKRRMQNTARKLR